MKKEVQETINRACIQAIEAYNNYVDDHEVNIEWKRLDYCQAWTANVGDYEVLKSYNTIIAIIYKPTNTLYDVLRYVYGYTPTSAKHVSKFRRGVARELTWRHVPC